MRYTIYIIILLIIWGCSNTNNSHSYDSEQKRLDSIKVDSIRQLKCDSLLQEMAKSNSGKVPLEGTNPKNLDECIYILDSLTSDTVKSWIRCVTEFEFGTSLHHGFGMYLRNTWGLWAESNLYIYFKEKYGIFHPDDMSAIILKCFHEYVNSGSYSVDDKVQYYLDYWNQIEEDEKQNRKIDSINFLKTEKFVFKLHEKINYDSIVRSRFNNLVYDSIFFFSKEVFQDTVKYIHYGGYSRNDTTEYEKWTGNERFGKTSFFGFIHNDGAIYTTSLFSDFFILKKDTIYYQVENGCFVPLLTRQMMRNNEIKQSWSKKKEGYYGSSGIDQIGEIEGLKLYHVRMRRSNGNPDVYLIDENFDVYFNRPFIPMDDYEFNPGIGRQAAIIRTNKRK